MHGNYLLTLSSYIHMQEREKSVSAQNKPKFGVNSKHMEYEKPLYNFNIEHKDICNTPKTYLEQTLKT